MTILSTLKVFATHPHTCSYLPEQMATTLFIDPAAPMNSETYSQLSEMGFRRSGPHLYRPHCARCNSCLPSRIAVEHFLPNRQQRRIWQRNADLKVVDRTTLIGEEYYALYAKYIEGRHRDGDMYPPTLQQFDSFLTREWELTHYYCFYVGEKLAAVAVVDVMSNGLSAIYTFYDPELGSRSLGVYAVLWQIEHTRALGLPHVYLGYWIKQCRKMSYKINYRPVELLINNRWVALV
ncbi:MAG TPA: arginyltransferase [Spongiibacteraceae bacterium]|nr:arginyltransferase [Spongiibacteraceae bacterium]